MVRSHFIAMQNMHVSQLFTFTNSTLSKLIYVVAT